MKIKIRLSLSVLLFLFLAILLVACNNLDETIKYQVTFDADGGNYNSVITVTSGELVLEPNDPIKTGFKFVEWQLDGEKFSFTTPITADITLIAVWDLDEKIPETYLVTFDSDGGAIITNQVVTSGNKVIKPNDPTKPNFTFVEWRLDGETFDFDTLVTKDLNLVAHWLADSNDLISVTFKVTFPANTPAGDIYFSGVLNHPDVTTNWSGAEVKALRFENTAEITLKYPANSLPISIQYKWTRGDWGTVEKGPNGEELANRTKTIEGSTIFNDKVDNWSDMLENHENSTVVGNLDIIELSYNGFDNPSQVTRKVRIWTPENYDASGATKYPVIYMHDGQNVFDDVTSFAGEWGADESMTALIDAGFSGAIIVGVDNSPARMGEYLYNHSFINLAQTTLPNTGHLYMEFLVDVVKPYVDSNYQTLTNRESTTIAGSSLGGLISLFGGLEHLDTFGNILAFSTSTQTVNFTDWTTYLETQDYSNYLNTKFFFYVGTSSDGNVNWPEQYKELLEGKGFTKIQTRIGNGDGHNEPSWRKHLPAALKWLFELE